jgi:glycosyltransferase involved in cell wall biosynthesis
MTPLSLSVVVPAYNAEASIGPTIEALAEALDRAPAFAAEVILVDDGSTDDTAAAAVAAASGRLDLRVVSQPNRGRFEARRAGIEAASRDWVLLLDSRVTLHADALSFVSERIPRGESVWNGHVHVRTDDNPYGAFWKVVVNLAWKDYLASPRALSFGLADFDRYPKGTGCFLARRTLLLEAFGRFRSYYSDLKVVSDDTAVIRHVAEREPIHLSPTFACHYEARSTLGSFFRQGIYRGTTFVDGHLRPESRFYFGAALFFPSSVALVIATIRRPSVALMATAVGSAGAAVAAKAAGCSGFEVRSFSLLAPVYAVAHGIGMWRGAILFGRSLVGHTRAR